MLMKNNFQSKSVPRGTRTIWRYLSALILLFSLSIGQMWAVDPDYESYDWSSSDADAVVGTHGDVVIGGAFGSKGNVSGHYYLPISNNLKNSDNPWNGYMSISSSSQIETIEIFYCPNGSNQTSVAWAAWGSGVTPNQKTLAHGVTTGTKSSKAWANAVWETIDLSGTEAYTVYLSRSIREFQDKDGNSIANFGGGQTINVLGIKVWLKASCTAPTGVSVGGGGEYTVGGMITLEGSATDNTGASTTYTWYKGDSWDAAKVTTPVQAAATAADGGNTFIKDPCALGDAGTYWCSIANSTCEAHASAVVTVVPAGGTKYDITYNNTKGATNTNPAQYTEGVGIASFAALPDVDGFHFTDWDPSSIAADASGDKTINAHWVPTYNVSFDKGAGSGTAPAGFQKWEDATFELPGQGEMVAPSGKAFDGWKASGVSYDEGDTYTMTASAVEFVAQWKNVPVTIFHWKSNTGTITIDAANGTTTGGTTTLRTADPAKSWGNESVTYNASVAADMKGETSGKELKPGGNANYLELTLTSGSFQEGDVISVTGYNNWAFLTSAEGIASATSFNVANVETGSGKGDAVTGSAIVPAGVDAATIYVRRANGSSSGIAAIKVTRIVKDIISTVNTLTDVKVGESSISAANLATLVSEHSLALSDALASAPTITFNQHTVITYEDYSTKTSDTPIPVVASDNGAGKWTASATIDAVTYTVTLNIASGHSVIYDANGGSGTMTDANLYAEGQEVTVLANEFTAPAANQKFNGWSSSPSVTISEGKFNMPASDVTLSAQWKEFFTITYMDGAAPLGTEDVFVGDAPVGLSPAPTKPLFSFAGWKDELDVDVDVTTLTAAATVYAKWNKAYASSVDLEGLVEAEGTGADWQAYMSSHNFAFSTSNVSLDAKASGKTYDNWPYQGLKMKSNGAYVEGNIHDDQLVIIKLGHMAAAANVSIDGVAAGTATGLDAAEPAGQLNYFYVANEAVLRYQTTDGNACILKAITITNPYEVTFNANGGEPVASQYGHPAVTLPDASNGTKSLLGWFDAAEGGNKIGDVGESYTPAADIELFAQWEDVSTDARLASITLDPSTGVWEPAFNPEVVNYTYTMPYGTVAVPQITGATAVNAGGSYSIVSQASAWDETAVIRGVAASSDTKAYNITMKIAPKDGTSIFKAELTSATSATYSGLYADADNSEIKLADDGANGYKFSGTSNYIKMALDGGTFATGDLLTMTYSTNPQQGELAIYENTTKIVGTPFENHTLEFTSGAEGLTELFIRRTSDNNFNGWVSVVEVTRVMDPVLKSITFDGTKINVTGTSVSATLPNGADLTDVTPEIFWNGAGTAVVTTHEGAWDWGANTYVLTDKDGDATSYTITLTEDVLKHTVSYYSYNGEDLLGTEQVEDGEHPTATGITAPSRLGFTFQGWAITVGGDVEDLNDIAISADDELYAVYAAIPCPTSGTVYKFEIKDGLASENLPIVTDMDMSSYIDATGVGLLTYSATANNKATINSDGTIQLKDATAAYLKVELACALAAGDQIRAHVSNNPIRVQVGTTYDSSKDLILDKNAYDIVDITAAMEGLKVLYIARSTNGNANLADFEIYRRPALTGASLADLTMRQGQNKTPELTLEPSADAIVTSQVWEITDRTNLPDATIDAATGAITTGMLDDSSINGTISVKVTLNGSIEATCTVTVVDAIVQADVTKSTIWDWHNTGATANIQLTNSSDPKKNENFVLANVEVNNNASFESDKLAVEGEYMVRDYNAANPYFQGQLIQFHTTVAGVVRVKFSHTGSNKPARELFVNGVGTGDTRTQATGEWSRYVEVPAGDVSLTAFHVDPADGAGQQYIRIFEIEFLEKLDSRTEYAAGELGTACYEYDAVVIGATPYMVAGVNGNGYIVFDEITSGVIDAGYPYLFEAAGGKVFFCKPVGVTADALVSGDEITVKGMVGTFTGTTLTQGDDDICYFSGRHIWRVNDFSVDIDVDPHRCYVNYDVLRAVPAAPAAAPGRRRITMGVNGKDEAQGFEDLDASETPMKVMIDGTLYIIRGEKVFDATGRLVK